MIFYKTFFFIVLNISLLFSLANQSSVSQKTLLKSDQKKPKQLWVDHLHQEQLEKIVFSRIYTKQKIKNWYKKDSIKMTPPMYENFIKELSFEKENNLLMEFFSQSKSEHQNFNNY